MKRKVLPLFVDSIIYCLLLELMEQFFVSAYMQDLSIFKFAGIPFIAALLSCISFIVVFYNEIDNRNLLTNILINICITLGILFVFFVIQVLGVNFNIFPTRELENVDGILIIVVSGIYILINLVFRFIFTAFVFIRNQIRHKRMK